MRIDLTEYDIDPAALGREIRRSGGPFECDPGPAYEYVGVVTPSTTIDRRASMAAAARSRGETANVDTALSEAREELREIDPGKPNLTAARRRVAETGTELDRLREQVATKRGELTARRESNGDTADAEADYRAEIRRLSEVETEHAAAREELADARDAARRTRDERERRLQLEDRVDNLERRAREELAASVEPVVERALRVAPDGAADLATADDPTVALAVARVADLTAPIVLADRRFSSVEAAGRWLDGPVVRL